jgi:fumarate reductase subunit C
MAFLSNGYSVKYMPIDYSPRAGESKFHWWKDTKLYLMQVVRMILSYNPLRVFLPLAVILGFFGLGKMILDWVDHDFRLAANTLLILFAAFQLLAIGLLADLFVRLSKPTAEVDPASL